MKRFIGIILAIIYVCILSCSKDESARTGKIIVRLTDSPATYDAVNIDIQDVQVHSNNGGWVSMKNHTGVYDLLKLTNGVDTVIGDVNIPSGRVSQIRLVLGLNNTIKVNGVTYPLQAPSADDAGLKLQVHYDIEADITYTIKLDFDAARSIVEKGNNTYLLKPVIRTITTAQDGAIKGVVLPAAAHPAIYAIAGADTATSYPDSSGKFLIRGLKSASYSLLFRPLSPFRDTAFTGVSVITGYITDVDTVIMH